MLTRLLLLLTICASLLSCKEEQKQYRKWAHYLGDPSRSHFSTLDQIDSNNLHELEVAWIYESPDTGQMQMNPIIVDGNLFGVTAALKAFALDAETGKEKWIFGDHEKVWHSTSRGSVYWQDGEDKRILYTMGSDLLALNAETGKLIETFGDAGRLDLHLGLPEVAQEKFIISNTPGAIYEDLIIMPVRVSEGSDAAPGDVRAFNIRDGSLAWTFHVIPHPGELGYDTWINKEAYQNESGIGAGNSWAGITVDEETGIIYVPTGSLAPDFYGGQRPGTNLFANCLLALDASTGKLLWYQQLTHHDIWDRDLPAPPNLLKIEKDGKEIRVVAQVTKQGYIFVFDRKTGKPIFEIVEEVVPNSRLEKAWPTQPIPVKPRPFARSSDELTLNDFSPYAPDKENIIKVLQTAQKSFYSPPDTNVTLLLPGYDGGAEWGGAGVDPEHGIIYVNSNEMAWLLQMEEVDLSEEKQMGIGELTYIQSCAVCHQRSLEGNFESGYPSLKEIDSKMGHDEILDIIHQGKGMMPGFKWIEEEKIEAIIKYIIDNENNHGNTEEIEINEVPISEPYKHTGYHKFLDENGLPAISPPWGTLSAIDLNNGDFLWQIPFGEVDSLMKLGYPNTGSENYGGPIITENGLLIIAATKDGKLRIYDRHKGKLLWEDQLPAASFATPSTYMVNGNQYIVVACGGEKLGTIPGNKIVAYRLKG